MEFPTFPDPIGRLLARLSWAMAVLGTIVITGLAVMLVVTIVTRKLLDWQVTGDHELVRIFGAFAVASMLPWCHIVGGNVVVDLFTQAVPKRGQDALDRAGSLLLAAVMVFLAWRTGVLVQESFVRQSFSPMLALPNWIFQLGMLPGLALTAVNALYLAVAPKALAARERYAATSEGIPE